MSRKWVLFAVFVAAGVALDWWSKQWALGSLQYARTQEAPAIVLRSLVVPEMAPAVFAPIYESASAVWKGCTRGASR